MTADPTQDLRSLGEAGYADDRWRPIATGTFANRPTVSLFRANAFYYATDTGTLYYSNGVAWVGAAAASTLSVAGSGSIAAANTDLALISSGAAINYFNITSVGGTLRSLGAPAAAGQVVFLRHGNVAPVFTIKHNLAGGTGNPIYSDSSADVIVPPGWTVTLSAINTVLWIITAIDAPASNAAPSQYGTSFPASPLDGSLFTLVDSITLSTYQWQFRYNASSSNADKWDFIGGAAAHAEVAADQSTASGTYTDLATAGPSFTTPRAGVYRIAAGFRFGVTNPSKIIQSIKYSAAEAADTESTAGLTGATKNSGDTAARLMAGIAVAASTSITTRYKSQDSTSASAMNRWIEVTPVRVS